MGFDEVQAAQAIRISIGPGVRQEDVLRFADQWSVAYARVLSRAA